MNLNKILLGDALTILKTLPNESLDCVITSPPYWSLRDYNNPGQLGIERDFNSYISNLCDIFDEVKRVLKKEGTCFVNMGDTYGNNGLLKKSLCQIPSRFAIEMVNRGWILRNEIIWHKPNCMPSSAKDRFTNDFEKVFFFVKNSHYFFDQQLEQAIWKNDGRAGLGRIHYRHKKREGKKGTGQENFVHIVEKRNKRAVWNISVAHFKDAHFAVFPEALIVPMIQAGCPRGGVHTRSIYWSWYHCSRI